MRSLLERRGARGHDSRNDHVSLLSCSLAQADLEALAERLRNAGRWLAVTVRRPDDPSALVPRFRDPLRVGFTLGGFGAEPEGRATAEFQGRRAPVPLANVTIDRLSDHSRYANQRDVWMLPRRLRMERAFELEREGGRDYHSDGRFLRVMRTGELVSLSMSESRGLR